MKKTNFTQSSSGFSATFENGQEDFKNLAEKAARRLKYVLLFWDFWDLSQRFKRDFPSAYTAHILPIFKVKFSAGKKEL